MNRSISLASRDPLPLGWEDIYEGMEKIGAYLDITPRDFREVYTHACKIVRERLPSPITAGDIIHIPVLCVAEGQSVRDLIIFLDDHRISGAPVVGTERRLPGTVSESDAVRFVGGGKTVTVVHLMHTLAWQGYVSGASLEASVDSIMTRECVSVGEGARLDDMLELLRAHQVNRIPVVDTGMQPVGIVSRAGIINTSGVMQ